MSFCLSSVVCRLCMFFLTSHGGEMLGFSNFLAISPFCQFLPRLSPLSLFLYVFVVKKFVNYLTFGRHLCIMNMSVNEKPLFISLFYGCV